MNKFKHSLAYILLGMGTSMGVAAQSTCANKLVLCNPNTSFAAPTGQASIGSVASCATPASPDNDVTTSLNSTPNPSFFSFCVSKGGNLKLEMINSANIDIDFAIWGPFANPSSACGTVFPTGTPKDCGYTDAANEYVNINNVQAGEFYVLLITNYKNQPTNVTLQPHASNTAQLGGPLQITFDSLANPLFMGASAFVIPTNPAVTNVNVTGEVFSGPGITNATTGLFNPTTAGVGVHTITVTATSYGCAATATKRMNVRTAATPLPLTLMQFKGAAHQDGIGLQWKVADEKEVADYEIEHSSDLRSFSMAGQVAATNAALEHDYSYLHKAPVAGNNYYRLRMNDVDGTYTYSAVVNVYYGKAGSVMLTPVPASDRVVLTHTHEDWMHRQVEIRNMMGGLVQTIILNGQQTNIDIAGLTKGFYLVRMPDGTVLRLEKI